jgi:tRNA A-37 threonylcarbamoyl transferase component Bud32
MTIKNEDDRAGNNNETNLDKDEEMIRALIALSKSTIPKALECPKPMQEITKLDLFQVNLSSLPSSLPAYLPNLSILFCMKNNFTEVPEVIGQCPKLQMFSFKSNKITHIHPEALQSQARWIILTDNQIKFIPSTIGRCSNLQKCMLSGNLLEKVPSEITNCHNLELIRLASNHLKEPPMELLQLPNLSWVAFSSNPFLTDPEDYDDSGNEEIHLKVFQDDHLDDASKGIELGKGASGITRQYTLGINEKGTEDKIQIPVAVKEYYSNITSDGNPQEERKVAMIASSLGCKSLVNVFGKTQKSNLIMELLKDYSVLAGPPSLESCSRDVYDEGIIVSDERAIALVGHLLQALTKLHEAGICHGDFYGHNILISNTDENHAWLTDFGAAFIYDVKSDYGELIESAERRAFSYLVSEVQNLVRSDNLPLKESLGDFARLCKEQTFTELRNTWSTLKMQ